MPPTPLLRASVSLCVLPVVLALALRAATAGEEGRGAEDARGADRLLVLQANIESAFGRCEAGPLKGAFSRRLKVYMSAGSLGIDGGYYGADQALLILRRVFADRTTVRFTLEAARPGRGGDSQAVTRARWTSRHAGAPAVEVRLSFTLIPKGEGWFLRELRELK